MLRPLPSARTAYAAAAATQIIRTVSSKQVGFCFSSLLFSVLLTGSVRQINLIIRQLFGAR